MGLVDLTTESWKSANTALTAVLVIAGAYVGIRWLLPWLAPLLLAGGAAAVQEPLVARLERRGLPRAAGAGLCLLSGLALAAGVLWLLLRRLTGELSVLTEHLPELLNGIAGLLERGEGMLENLLARAPEELRLWLERAAEGAAESLSALPMRWSAAVLGWLPALAAAAPSALLFAITLVLGTYFISASYPELLHAGARLLPERLLCRARLFRRALRRTLGRWLRAQLLLLAITFAVLAAAFLLLRVDYALLLALGTAVIDALPVLGTGTVLLPWAGYELLTGRIPLGVGIGITYAAVTVIHQSVQAKLLGDQLGLHPLTTLAAIYVGFRVWGVWGMLSFPLLATCGKQLLDSGLISRRGATVY